MAQASIQLFNLLGPLVGDRIYPRVVPEGYEDQAPYIIYQRISAQPEITLDGFSGYEWVSMQIDIYHDNDYAAELLANQVIHKINTQIEASIYDTRRQGQDPDTGLYFESVDYEFWQTAPITG